MTNVINSTTPSDVATTTAIDSTAFTSPSTIAVISITGQKTAGAALAAASNAAKAIRLQTTIDDCIEDRNTIGTVTTEITQNQANEIHQIQANLDNCVT